MKKATLFTVLAIFALTLIGCETTKETNSNKAVVVNNNANINANTAPRSNTNVEKKGTSREDFDKDKAKYEKEAKESKSTIGQGANDLWLWTKVRGELLTVDGLRESTVNVDVENDVVTLKGTVGTKAQQENAVKAAKAVEGVKEVKDMLKVAPEDSMTNTSTKDDGKTDADKMKTNSNK
jgi:hyperosmotically inducible protein